MRIITYLGSLLLVVSYCVVSRLVMKFSTLGETLDLSLPAGPYLCKDNSLVLCSNIKDLLNPRK